MGEALTVRAFAKLIGVSHVAVLKAIERGRLRHSVRVNSFGKPEVFDPELARREWADNAGRVIKSALPAPTVSAPVTPVTPPVTTTQNPPQANQRQEYAPQLPAPESPQGPIEASSLADAQRLSALELARQRRLANQIREGQLIPADAVKKLQFEATRVLRENLLNIPARISGQLSAETDPGRVYLLLDAAIRVALQTTGAQYRAEADAIDDPATTTLEEGARAQ